MLITRLCILSVIVVLSACASAPSQPLQQKDAETAQQAGTESKPQIVKSRDGSFEGEVIGVVRPGSKFAQLQIGMNMSEVQTIFDRVPDRSHNYESGKRWIPFYFGNDARRMQVLYREEGCLIFADGGVFGSAGGELIQIQHDPSGVCYQP